MSGDGGDGFKNRRRNEKMREDSAFKEDEAIFIILQYGKSSSISGTTTVGFPRLHRPGHHT